MLYGYFDNYYIELLHKYKYNYLIKIFDIGFNTIKGQSKCKFGVTISSLEKQVSWLKKKKLKKLKKKVLTYLVSSVIMYLEVGKSQSLDKIKSRKGKYIILRRA